MVVPLEPLATPASGAAPAAASFLALGLPRLFFRLLGLLLRSLAPGGARPEPGLALGGLSLGHPRAPPELLSLFVLGVLDYPVLEASGRLVSHCWVW